MLTVFARHVNCKHERFAVATDALSHPVVSTQYKRYAIEAQ